MSVTNITPSVTLQPKASAAALDDFNLDGETFADLLRTSMNKEQWFMQTNKKTTQPLAMHKLVGKIWVRHSGGPPFRGSAIAGAAIPGFSNALAAGDSDIEPIDVVAAGA